MRRRVGRPGLLGTAARTAVIAGTATAVSGNVAQKQATQQQAAAHKAAAQQAQAEEIANLHAQVSALQTPPPPAATPASADLMAQLQQLAQMFQAGILSEAEFSAAKAKLLG